MKKLLLLLSLFVTGASAQFYTTTQSVALTATAAVVTVQQKAAPTKGAKFVSAYISSTVAATFTLERNGTAATTTAGTINSINPNEFASSTTSQAAFTASNVGAGTVLGNYQLSAGGSQVIDLSKITFPSLALPTGVQNLTFRTNSITGSVAIVILWQELVF